MTGNKCDNCQAQFNCVSESGNCDEAKERYVPLEDGLPDEVIWLCLDHNVEGTAP